MEEKIYSMPVAGGERFVLHLKTAGIIISFDDLEILVILIDPGTWLPNNRGDYRGHCHYYYGVCVNKYGLCLHNDCHQVGGS